MHDLRSTEELFQAALEGGYEDDAPWQAVAALRSRGGDEVFALAVHLCGSPSPLERARAIDVIAQIDCGLNGDERPHFAECVDLALAALGDSDAQVVRSGAYALGHLRDSRCVEALLDLAGHPDAGVRHAVAFGLGGVELDAAFETLCRLTRDPDDEARNWATFGIGALTDRDSPELRGVLRQRLADPFEDARLEAVWGLARRGDAAGLSALLAEFESGAERVGDVEAAKEALGIDGDEPDMGVLRDRLRELLARPPAALH